MKKCLVLISVLILGLAVLAAAGCGGDTSQAKTDMKTADAAYAGVKTQMDALGTSLTTVLGGAVSGNFSALTPQVITTAETTIDGILAQIPKVKADYSKIASLSGVPDYVSYSNAMIKALDLDTVSLTAGKKLIGDIKPMVQAGDTAAITKYFQTNAATISQLQSQSAAADKAYADALTIKSSKKLGQ
jgi:hypothetical protein